jgi:hypothetical protein
MKNQGFAGLGVVVLVVAVAMWAAPAAAQPALWESSFGAELTALTGEDDEEDSVTLGFNFPFDGTDYTTIYVGNNGDLQLGGLGDDGDIDYDHWEYMDEFYDDSDPVLSVFNCDLDQSTTGTVHFNDFGSRAVFTWNEVGTNEEETHLLTFQVQLQNDGTITYCYNGILDGSGEDYVNSLDEGIVIGVSASDGTFPGPSDLTNTPFSGGFTIYEGWCYNSADSCDGFSGPTNAFFDLDQSCVVFTPQVNGFDVETQQAGQPIPALGTTGFAILAVVLASLGVLVLRRRLA